jgi:hypothetical protein
VVKSRKQLLVLHSLRWCLLGSSASSARSFRSILRREFDATVLLCLLLTTKAGRSEVAGILVASPRALAYAFSLLRCSLGASPSIMMKVNLPQSLFCLLNSPRSYLFLPLCYSPGANPSTTLNVNLALFRVLVLFISCFLLVVKPAHLVKLRLQSVLKRSIFPRTGTDWRLQSHGASRG